MSSAGYQYRNLDVLRAMAVSYVFLDHAILILHPPVWLTRPVEAFGRFGVILFFFHTSFVLMQSLESLDPTSNRWAMRFYLRRVFRIYPLAIFVILCALAMHTPFAPWDPSWHPARTVRAVFANLLLVQNFTGSASIIVPMWSLPIEIQMYALLPAIFLAVRRPQWKGLMLTMWVVAAVSAALVYLTTRHMNLLAFVPCFLSGAIAYRLTRFTQPTWHSSLWIPSILLITVGSVLFTQIATAEWLLCLALALLFTRIKDMRASPLTKSSGLVAKYSYGIYLFHLFGLWLAFLLLPGYLSSIVRIVVAVAVTAVASVASFHAIEDPLIGTGKKIASRLKQTKPLLSLRAANAPLPRT
jgi:peptidoglycan/LPS O-acetylase OafA/YrhL